MKNLSVYFWVIETRKREIERERRGVYLPFTSKGQLQHEKESRDDVLSMASVAELSLLQ